MADTEKLIKKNFKKNCLLHFSKMMKLLLLHLGGLVHFLACLTLEIKQLSYHFSYCRQVGFCLFFISHDANSLLASIQRELDNVQQ